MQYKRSSRRKMTFGIDILFSLIEVTTQQILLPILTIEPMKYHAYQIPALESLFFESRRVVVL